MTMIHDVVIPRYFIFPPCRLTSPLPSTFRMEIFYPPFWYDFVNKPNITAAPREIGYGQGFAVSYAGPKVRQYVGTI